MERGLSSSWVSRRQEGSPPSAFGIRPLPLWRDLEPIAAHSHGEVMLDAPTQLISERISDEDLRAACESPLAYLAILHRYLDGGLTALGAPAQLIFLHLMKETLARGRRTVRITIRTLTEKTGLSKETVAAALRTLASPEVDLLNVVARGGPHAPAQYEVRWYTYRKAMPGSVPTRTRLRAEGRAGSLENRLKDLTPEEREKLELSYVSLAPKDRKELEERVISRLQELGLTVEKSLFHQLVLFEVLRSHMYHYMKKHHPHAFSFHPVV